MIAINPRNIHLAKTKYFELINPKNKNGSYHKRDALASRIKEKLTTTNKNQHAFWQYLFDNLRILLLGELEVLQTHKKELERLCLKANISKKSILETFKYKTFRQSKRCQQLAEWLDIKVCPYCNENYTCTTLITNKNAKNEIKLDFDFDHFLDKATNPYFSLSLYNLIPSCKVCNSSYKGKANFDSQTHIHPYKQGFGDDCKFMLTIQDIDFITQNAASVSLNLEIQETIKSTDKGKQIQGNLDAFKLNARYQNHKDYALELIHKNIVYNEDYVDSLYQQYEGTLFKNREDVLRLITTNYIEEQDLGKRPLAKLTRDIVEGLGLI
jgi:hypothetical protein